MEACELLTPDGNPLGFGETEVWGVSIPRVLRTLGCMTQARWAWLKNTTLKCCELFEMKRQSCDTGSMQDTVGSLLKKFICSSHPAKC